MRSVEPEDLERMLDARYRARIWLIVVVGAVILLTGALISADLAFPGGLCVLVGLAIGRLINAPYLRLLNELGLSRQEGTLILVAEQERRSGRAALPPQVRAQRDQVASTAYLIGGIAAGVVLVISAVYFFSKANQTVDENAPTDVWFAVSVIAGFASLVLTPTFLRMSSLHRADAKAWRGEQQGKRVP